MTDRQTSNEENIIVNMEERPFFLQCMINQPNSGKKGKEFVCINSTISTCALVPYCFLGKQMWWGSCVTKVQRQKGGEDGSHVTTSGSTFSSLPPPLLGLLGGGKGSALPTRLDCRGV